MSRSPQKYNRHRIILNNYLKKDSARGTVIKKMIRVDFSGVDVVSVAHGTPIGGQVMLILWALHE